MDFLVQHAQGCSSRLIIIGSPLTCLMPFADAISARVWPCAFIIGVPSGLLPTLIWRLHIFERSDQCKSVWLSLISLYEYGSYCLGTKHTRRGLANKPASALGVSGSKAGSSQATRYHSRKRYGVAFLILYSRAGGGIPVRGSPPPPP